MDAVTAPTSELTCPTCNARQEWSPECRRCRCDLSDLRKVFDAAQSARHSCLRNLAANSWRAALLDARQYHRLRPNPDSLKLLAVTELLNENWEQAWSAARCQWDE